MIGNLKIKLNRNELQEFVKAIRALHKYSFEFLGTDDYLHYYNLKSILFKCLFKMRDTQFTERKKSVLISMNEFESMKYVAKEIDTFNSQYHDIFITEILHALQKQVETYNHIEYNTNNHATR